MKLPAKLYVREVGGNIFLASTKDGPTAVAEMLPRATTRTRKFAAALARAYNRKEPADGDTER